jgi:hypothetical protein
LSSVTALIEAYRVHSSRIAAAFLVITNLIPLAGVLWLGWDLMLILALYWAENGIVGVINVLKILTAEGRPPENFPVSVNGRPATSLTRVGTAGFFCVHYGIFWIVHGFFVFTFVPAMTGMGSFGGAFDPSSPGPAGPVGPAGPFGDALTALPDLLLAGVVGLAISHGVSFWTNYLGRGEYRRLSPAEVMAQPYGRLVILHLTINVGAFVSIFLGTPIGSLLVLVVLKTALDLYFHLRQHRSAPDPASTGDVFAR